MTAASARLAALGMALALDAAPALALFGSRKEAPQSAIDAYAYERTTSVNGTWKSESKRMTFPLAGVPGARARCLRKPDSHLTFRLPLSDPRLLGARATRVTVTWTAIKTGAGTAGLRLDVNGRHNVDLRRAAQGSTAGRLVMINVPAASVRKDEALKVRIEVNAQCAGSGSSAWSQADQLQLEVLP